MITGYRTWMSLDDESLREPKALLYDAQEQAWICRCNSALAPYCHHIVTHGLHCVAGPSDPYLKAGTCPAMWVDTTVIESWLKHPEAWKASASNLSHSGLLSLAPPKEECFWKKHRITMEIMDAYLSLLQSRSIHCPEVPSCVAFPASWFGEGNGALQAAVVVRLCFHEEGSHTDPR